MEKNSYIQFDRTIGHLLRRKVIPAAVGGFVSCLTVACLMAASPVRKTVQTGGLEREYLVYAPENTRSLPEGVIVCLHGFNGSGDDFFGDYPVYKIADSLNYLIIAPQALPEQNRDLINKAALISVITGNKLSLQAAWGCGLKVKAVMNLGNIVLLDDELNRPVDDVEFIRLIIRQTVEEFALKSENIFLVGTSMGGYMAYQFALKQPVKLTGIVSIVGSMGLNIRGMGDGMKVPVCDFHSVTDEVVPYTGSNESS
ncbi:MAG: hypothetical protein LBK22_06480, partial [Tannerella sp.]|nr:hypothetical protein [Tannerella sp.]